MSPRVPGAQNVTGGPKLLPGAQTLTVPGALLVVLPTVPATIIYQVSNVKLEFLRFNKNKHAAGVRQSFQPPQISCWGFYIYRLMAILSSSGGGKLYA